MSLIKAANSAQLVKDAVVLDMSDLRRQANELNQQAQAQADRIVAEAGIAAEQMLADAQKSGYEQGHTAGRTEGHEQGLSEGHHEALSQHAETLSAVTTAWDQALQTWDADRSALMIDARRNLLELAIAIAGKIVKRVPPIDPTIVQDQLESALAYIARPADVVVRICPEDRPHLVEAMPKLIERFQQVGHAELLDDADVQPGGCVISYGTGHIDATLDGQLDRLIAMLLPDAAGEDRSESTKAEPTETELPRTESAASEPDQPEPTDTDASASEPEPDQA